MHARESVGREVTRVQGRILGKNGILTRLHLAAAYAQFSFQLPMVQAFGVHVKFAANVTK